VVVEQIILLELLDQVELVAVEMEQKITQQLKLDQLTPEVVVAAVVEMLVLVEELEVALAVAELL
jgi:hypothetical protein